MILCAILWCGQKKGRELGMWCALLSPEVERNGIEDVSRSACPFQRVQHVYYRLTFYQIPLFLTQQQSRAEIRSGDSL